MPKICWHWSNPLYGPKTISHRRDQFLQRAFAGWSGSDWPQVVSNPSSSFTIEAGKGFLKILFPVSSAKSGDHWHTVLPTWKSAETVSQKISLSKLTGTNLVGTGPPLLVLAAKEDEPRVIATILLCWRTLHGGITETLALHNWATRSMPATTHAQMSF